MKDQKVNQKEAQKLLDKFPNNTLDIVDNYDCMTNYCTVRCRICGRINNKCKISQTIFHFKNGKGYSTGCRHCSAVLMTYNKRLSVDTIRNVFKTNNITNVKILSYNYRSKRIKLECKNCHYRFDKKYKNCNFDIWAKCPECNHKESSGEHITRRILEYNHIKFIQEYAFNNGYSQQRIDFYLVDYHIALEVMGDQHFNKKNGLYTEREVRLDKIKSDWCKKNKIDLHYLYYDQDFYSQLKSILFDLEKPDHKFMMLQDSKYQQIINDLLNGLSYQKTREKYSISDKTATRYSKLAGYHDYLEIHYQGKLHRLGLTEEKIIDYLRTHNLKEVRKLGITPKFVSTHIFHKDKYPYDSQYDIVDDTIQSTMFKKFRCTHSKKSTCRHLHTDNSHVVKIWGTNW